ncbi:olfactory receptor 5L1-like [Loxodonta africana]|uniref:olfactory receptor 5L1-like n=1 Tax=Loxodonta africana TaxID=9785 RepID=UPI0030CF3EF0
MIVIIKINPKFHTPMYFFLSHLSFVDFCYSSIVTPKLLENFVMADKSIFYFSCMLQYFPSCTAVVTESFLLAVMAYDRFVAICNPLLYTVAMSQRLCALLLSLALINAFLTFCFLGLPPSMSGRRKAFSTCASHLTAITIFHGTILSLYCVPNSKNSRQTVKVASVFYTVVNPMLNPLIYSLRNKDTLGVSNTLWILGGRSLALGFSSTFQAHWNSNSASSTVGGLICLVLLSGDTTPSALAGLILLPLGHGIPAPSDLGSTPTSILLGQVNSGPTLWNQVGEDLSL